MPGRSRHKSGGLNLVWDPETKGRLSAKIARKLPFGQHPPGYIAAAIRFVADRV
jgi:hypothetical protein